MKKREQLATMLFCRSYLYYSDILTESEATKVFERIKKFQEKNRINISMEQINSIEITYKDGI